MLKHCHDAHKALIFKTWENELLSFDYTLVTWSFARKPNLLTARMGVTSPHHKNPYILSAPPPTKKKDHCCILELMHCLMTENSQELITYIERNMQKVWGALADDDSKVTYINCIKNSIPFIQNLCSTTPLLTSSSFLSQYIYFIKKRQINIHICQTVTRQYNSLLTHWLNNAQESVNF